MNDEGTKTRNLQSAKKDIKIDFCYHSAIGAVNIIFSISLLTWPQKSISLLARSDIETFSKPNKLQWCTVFWSFFIKRVYNSSDQKTVFTLSRLLTKLESIRVKNAGSNPTERRKKFSHVIASSWIIYTL